MIKRLFILFFVFLLEESSALAAIVSTTGNVTAYGTVPSDLSYQAFPSDNISVFTEQQNVEIVAGPATLPYIGLLPIDILAQTNTTYDSASDLTLDPNDILGTIGGSTILPFGTVVNSYLIHFDPTFSFPSPSIPTQGTITFEGDILGFILRKPTLEFTDATFGLATTYEDSGSFDYTDCCSRGLNPFDQAYSLDTDDVFSIGSNPRTVSLSLLNRFAPAYDLDEMRILTLAPAAVPLPGAVWLFGSGLLGLIGMARRKKKHPAMASDEGTGGIFKQLIGEHQSAI